MPDRRAGAVLHDRCAAYNLLLFPVLYHSKVQVRLAAALCLDAPLAFLDFYAQRCARIDKSAADFDDAYTTLLQTVLVDNIDMQETDTGMVRCSAHSRKTVFLCEKHKTVRGTEMY